MIEVTSFSGVAGRFPDIFWKEILREKEFVCNFVAMRKVSLIMMILACCLFLVAGCVGGPSSTEAVGKIDRAMDMGDHSEAQRECDRLFHNPLLLDSLSIPDLCHLAIIMADLADSSDDCRDRNAAQAVLCYRTALRRDSMATVEYLRSLDTEEYRHVYLLNQLLRPITDREDGVIYASDDACDADSVSR